VSVEWTALGGGKGGREVFFAAIDLAGGLFCCQFPGGLDGGHVWVRPSSEARCGHEHRGFVWLEALPVCLDEICLLFHRSSSTIQMPFERSAKGVHARNPV
jgi:hypothetical protein